MSESAAAPVIVEAKFPGKCKVCGAVVPVGTKMQKLAMPGTISKYAHIQCAQKVTSGEIVYNADNNTFEIVGAPKPAPIHEDLNAIPEAAPVDDVATASDQAEPAVEPEAVETPKPVEATTPEAAPADDDKKPERKPRRSRKAAAEATPVEAVETPKPVEATTPEAAPVPAQVVAVSPGGDASNPFQMMIDAFVASADAKIQAAAYTAVQQHVSKPKTITIRYERNDKDAIITENIVMHEKMPECVDIVKAGLNLLMVGPSQCGKSYLAEQLAQVMGLSFDFVNCSIGMSESAFLGRLLPIGDGGKFEFIQTGFIRAWRDGGVLLVDEFDAIPADVAISLNNAMSSGQLKLVAAPGQPIIKRHPDCHIIAAANTWGAGADRMYCGRQQLDFATLQRFVGGEVSLDYDDKIERLILEDVDADLMNVLWAIRGVIRRINAKTVMSLRREITTAHFKAAAKLKQVGWKSKRVLKKLLESWTREEMAKIKAEMPTLDV